MNIEIRMGGERGFALEHALLVYGDGVRSFATLHAPSVSKRGVPSLNAGTPVSSAFLRALTTRLGESIPVEVLPDTVLCRTSEMLAWWRPAASAALFYQPTGVKHGDALTAISGRRLPQPALVFKATRSQLWVRALAENARPTATTPMYQAPYFNVSTTGGVCLGSMRRPGNRGIASIAEWERGFFESAFTHPLPGTKLTSFPGGFTKLWMGIAMLGLSSFPTCALEKPRSLFTLEEFVKDANVGQL